MNHRSGKDFGLGLMLRQLLMRTGDGFWNIRRTLNIATPAKHARLDLSCPTVFKTSPGQAKRRLIAVDSADFDL